MNAKGFTLLEMVVTLVVVIVLAMLTIPAYNQYIIKSRRGDAHATLEMIALAQEQWRADHTTYGSLNDIWPQGVSRGGFYTITLTNVTGATFTATATVKAGTPQAKDTPCAAIQLNQGGPVVATHAEKTCWNK